MPLIKAPGVPELAAAFAWHGQVAIIHVNSFIIAYLLELKGCSGEWEQCKHAQSSLAFKHLI
jgi:hypothetical protein